MDMDVTPSRFNCRYARAHSQRRKTSSWEGGGIEWLRRGALYSNSRINAWHLEHFGASPKYSNGNHAH
jgi:hypothetical protein